MKRELHERITQVVAISGAALTVLAFTLWGVRGGLGAFAGALVAMANWGVIRWVSIRITDQHVQRKNKLFLLLGLKTAGLMALCWILLAKVGLDPKGFMIGIGALVAGIVIGPLSLSEKPSAPPSSNPSEDRA